MEDTHFVLVSLGHLITLPQWDYEVPMVHLLAKKYVLNVSYIAFIKNTDGTFSMVKNMYGSLLSIDLPDLNSVYNYIDDNPFDLGIIHKPVNTWREALRISGVNLE